MDTFDVLKPPLLWLDGKCYRVPVSITRENDETYEARPISSHYEEDIGCCVAEESDPEDGVDYEVEMTENGRYRSVLQVPRTFFGCLIGPKGTVRRRLEEETRTQIRIPSKTQRGDIVVTGRNEKDVKDACRRMNLIITASKEKPQKATHFLSIPMIGIKNRYLMFKEEVSKMMTPENRITASVFQNPDKLHMTLGMMVLHDEIEHAKVAKLLLHFKETYIVPLLGNKPLNVRVVGVEYFNDDPSEVHVLFGKVSLADESDTLQQLADNLANFFFKEGFIVQKEDRVKLHITVMNSYFCTKVSEQEDSKTFKRLKRETFDATEILKMFGDYDFGEQCVNTIHVSQLGAKGVDGYYKMSASINL